jgi:hypothetical protein
MKAFMRRSLRTLRGLFGLHVEYNELLAYRDVRRQLFLLLDDNYFSLSTTITS